MATRRPKPRLKPDTARRSQVFTQPWDQRLERMATGIALMLLVARPLFPSEDAESGSGLILVALWGLATFIWLAAQTVRAKLECAIHWVDIGPVILLGAVWTSAFLCDTPRPSINMACEWTGLILSYILMRQLFRSPQSQRLLIFAMLSVAAALAVYAIYQVFWGLESLRVEYARNRLRFLQELQIPPDSPQELTFLNRLNSHEPFATFALANSLAGLLLCWLPLSLAWYFSPLWRQQSNAARPNLSFFGRVKRAAIGATVVLLLLLALLLTQSRTAYVGMIVQLVLFSFLLGPALWRRTRDHLSLVQLAGIGTVALAMLCAFVFMAWQRGKIDEKLLTQAQKSFGYRLQYWEATLRLIAEQPWSGTGPGNFRGPYLRHKLAESSEDIADPHNMLLELTATSGVVAGAALAGSLVLALALMIRGRAAAQSGTSALTEPRFRSGVAGAEALRSPGRGIEDSAPATQPKIIVFRDTSVMQPIDLWLAGVGAFVIAALIDAAWYSFSIGPLTYLCLFAVWSLAGVVVMWLSPELEIGPRIAAIAILGGAIHLLGAGGISMPGVAQSLWAMLALGMSTLEVAGAPRAVAGRKPALVAALCTLAILSYFVVAIVWPVSESVWAVSRGRRLVAGRDRAGAEVQYRYAAVRDPLWAEPWLELSRIHYERWLATRGQASEEQFGHAVAALDAARRLAPSSLQPVRVLAGLYEARAERDSTYWDKVAETYQRCTEMYPTSASLHTRLARALAQAGRTDAAREAAHRARQLDSQMPHADRKLTELERAFIEPLQAP